MPTTEHGDGWTVDVEDGLMLWEFEQGMNLAAFEAQAYPVFEDLLESHDVTAMVTVVRLDDPFTADVFNLWEESGQRLDAAGGEKWALVADGVKAISLRGKIDVGDLDVHTTERREDAVEWARDDADPPTV
jgi:hypothetical protein